MTAQLLPDELDGVPVGPLRRSTGYLLDFLWDTWCTGDVCRCRFDNDADSELSDSSWDVTAYRWRPGLPIARFGGTS